MSELIGNSKTMQTLRRQLTEVAQCDLSVLLLGETGTGKGVAARSIHEQSARRDQAFVHVNCGAMQEGLVDSELFGHEKGAFTGAVQRRIGKCELAEGGTLFLDEIGDLPLASQTRLLRVLQEREFERVGGDRSIPLDVRVIAATHRDLAQGIRERWFRADLYYRLNVIPIAIPALRERIEDIELLAMFFIDRVSLEDGVAPQSFHPDAVARLRHHTWPGNVRELAHAIQRACLYADGHQIGVAHLSIRPEVLDADEVSSMPDGESQILPLDDYIRRYLRRVLLQTGGIIHGAGGAASLLGVRPTALRSRMEKLGLRKDGGCRGEPTPQLSLVAHGRPVRR